jgi:hypothetical protein
LEKAEACGWEGYTYCPDSGWMPPVGGTALARLSVPVCMTPRALASEETLRARRAGFASRLPFTHWPHEAVTHSGRKPSAREPIELTPEMRALL